MKGGLVRYLWAGPWTAVAALAVPLVVVTGGRARVVRGVLEVHGGLLPAILRRMPPGPVAAITLGHAVLGVDEGALERTRAHERVHVGQFEAWGPLFPLAYAMASVDAWGAGRHYYRDNHFEIEARRLGD